MNDAGRMRRRKRLGNLGGVVQCRRQSQSLAANRLTQRLAGQILHDDEVEVLVTSNLINRDDVGMVESGSRVGLLDKPLLPRRISHKFRWEHLDGDIPS